MVHHVDFQGVLQRVTFVAQVTCERLAARVRNHVVLQVAQVNKALIAHVTLKGLLFGMGQQVLVEDHYGPVPFLADIAFVRSFARVRPNMILWKRYA